MVNREPVNPLRDAAFFMQPASGGYEAVDYD